MDSLETLTQNLPALALTPPTELDHLPEELLDKVVSCLRPAYPKSVRIPAPSNLVNLSLVSRKLHRIVEPHIYTSVSITLNKLDWRLKVQLLHQNGDITVCKCDIPTTEGSNAGLFLRTIESRPDLARHVKFLWLSRQDRGFRARRDLGFYGFMPGSHPKLCLVGLAKSNPAKPFPYDVWQPTKDNALPLTLSMDPASQAVRDILRMLPNIMTLVCLYYITDTPWDPVFEIATGLSAMPLELRSFAHLTDLRIWCNKMHLADTRPLFTLPVLRQLCLSGGVVKAAGDGQIERWKDVGTSHVRSILLEAPSLKYRRHDTRNPLVLISLVCANLEGLNIITRDPNRQPSPTAAFLGAFAPHFNILRHVATYDMSSRPAMAGAFAAVSYASGYMDRLRESRSLRTLVIDIIDLLAVFPESEFIPTLKGVLQQTFTFEHLPGQRYRAILDLRLPPSLVSLILGVGAEGLQRRAVIDALEGMVGNSGLRTRFPVLQNIQVSWDKCDLGYFPRINKFGLADRFRQQGVLLDEVHLGF